MQDTATKTHTAEKYFGYSSWHTRQLKHARQIFFYTQHTATKSHTAENF